MFCANVVTIWEHSDLPLFVHADNVVALLAAPLNCTRDLAGGSPCHLKHSWQFLNAYLAHVAHSPSCLLTHAGQDDPVIVRDRCAISPILDIYRVWLAAVFEEWIRKIKIKKSRSKWTKQSAHVSDHLPSSSNASNKAQMSEQFISSHRFT